MSAKIRLAECDPADLGTVPANKVYIFLDANDNILKAKRDDQTVVVLDITKQYFQASQSVAQTGITTETTVIFDVETQNSSVATFSYSTTTGVITINSTSEFKFDINCTFDTGNNARQTSKIKLQRWDGFSFVDIPTTEAHASGFGYHRNASSGENTIDVSPIISVNAGDQFRVVAESTGFGPIDSVPEGTGITIEEQ